MVGGHARYNVCASLRFTAGGTELTRLRIPLLQCIVERQTLTIGAYTLYVRVHARLR